MNAQEIRTYSQELATKKGLPAEKVQKFLEALGDDQIAQMIAEGFIDTPTYSRSLDGKVAEAKAALDKVKGYDEWYAKNNPIFVSAQETLRKYKEKFGDLTDANPNPDPKPQVNGEYLTKAQLEEAIGKMRGDTGQVLKQVMRANADYYHRFKEPMDVDAFEKFVVEKNLPIDVAYKEYIEPKVREADAKATQERIDREVSERVRTELAKHSVPLDTAPKEPHLLFDQVKPAGDSNGAQGSRGGLNDFISGWTDYAAKTQ